MNLGESPGGLLMMGWCYKLTMLRLMRGPGRGSGESRLLLFTLYSGPPSCPGPYTLAYHEADLAATHDVIQEGVDLLHLAGGG